MPIVRDTIKIYLDFVVDHEPEAVVVPHTPAAGSHPSMILCSLHHRKGGDFPHLPTVVGRQNAPVRLTEAIDLVLGCLTLRSISGNSVGLLYEFRFPPLSLFPPILNPPVSLFVWRFPLFSWILSPSPLQHRGTRASPIRLLGRARVCPNHGTI